MAGSYGTPKGLVQAKELGAQGIQSGSPFAFCDESGISATVKTSVLEQCRQKIARVFTDAQASPTGFPFKVVEMKETMSEKKDYEARRRVCDLGYLRQMYRKDDGSVGYRCAAEPEGNYIKKGGDEQETVGRKCLCNGLMATVGLGQKRKDGDEKPLITAGDSVVQLVRFLSPERLSYTAADVLRYLRTGIATPAEPQPVEAAESR